jgi:hypothetical protein
MTDPKLPPADVSIRLPLWRILDALQEMEGDEYLELRDAIIAAINDEVQAMWEIAIK